MITLIQTDDFNRLDVRFEDDYYNEMVTALLKADSSATRPIDGYVMKTEDGTYIGYGLDGVTITEPFTNPVEAGKLIVPDYEKRAYRVIERSIARLESELPAMAENAIKQAKIRMIAAMKARLVAGDF